MFNSRFKKTALMFGCTLSILALIFFAATPVAFAQIPFGGAIATIVPCSNGLLLTLGPPRGGLFMYQYGVSFSPYLYFPPSHPGQWVLGWSSGVVPCFAFSCPPCVLGAGLLILPIHGTSL